MRRSQRLIASAVLISLCGVLAGCSSSLSNWDPSDLLDFLDTKKKLPGKREAVFPEGVPGIEQGVPKELYKDNVERQQQEQAAAASAAIAPPAEEPKPQPAVRSKGRSKPASAAPAEEGAAAAVAPTPKPKRLVHRRATSLPKEEPAPQEQAPPPQQQPAQQTQPAASPFPAPLPSGSFSR